MLKKRNCERYIISGTTLFYKYRSSFFKKHKYSHDYFPVINISKGGAKFLCNNRLKAGKSLIIKVNIPGIETKPEIMASVKWISKNPEESYKYQTGIAFNSYGDGKNENSQKVLDLLETLEKKLGID
jgi:hypothetical protein